MRCKPCSHLNRNQIDLEIVNGRPLRAISETFGLSLGSLHRHKAHLKEALSNAMQAAQNERTEHGSDLLHRAEKLVAAAESILESARTRGDLKGGTSAICAAVRVLELIGRLDGSLAQPNAPGLHLQLSKTVNITSYGDNDQEIAELVREATGNWNPTVVEHLKALTAGQ